MKSKKKVVQEPNLADLFDLRKLASKIIKSNVFAGNAQVIKHILNSRKHQWWPTQVIFNLVGVGVLFELVFLHYVMNKTYVAFPIIFG